MVLGYVPPRYLWIVTFEDGQALSQFDPETGKQNKFPFQDQSRITKIGWFPIGTHMAIKILEGEGVVTVPNEYPIYEITLKPGQLPYMRYNTRIPPGQFRKCLECGAQWIFSFGKPDHSIVKQGYPWRSNHKFVDTDDGPRSVEVCPECGYHNMPWEKEEEKRIVRMATDMRYLVYKIGVEDPQGKRDFFMIDQWGEVFDEN